MYGHWHSEIQSSFSLLFQLLTEQQYSPFFYLQRCSPLCSAPADYMSSSVRQKQRKKKPKHTADDSKFGSFGKMVGLQKDKDNP